MTTGTLRASTSTIAVVADPSIVVNYHVAPSTPEDEVNAFWFEDEQDAIIGLRRKLGVERTDGLIARIRSFPDSTCEAAEDPRDPERLIVAATVEELDGLVRAARG
jgi:hypothetical protein